MSSTNPIKLPECLGEVGNLAAVLQNQVVDEVVVLSPIERRALAELTRCCMVRGTVLSIMMELPPPRLGTWNIDHCGDGIFRLSLAAVPQDALRLALKRLIDIAGAIVGLIVCAGAYIWYGRRLRRESGASPLFRQSRVGHNGRRFTLYKFRTMYRDSEERLKELTVRNVMNGPMFKLVDDPRVTPTGRQLRERHLDELPQFWNVLKAEMSLVGTRPPTGDEVSVYRDYHHRRLSMRPGLTGLWQLNGNHKVNDFEDVVKLDCEYIDNWSLRLDFRIIVQTIKKVLRADAW
jgi:lipopolysaccharide/colanic/teichoic acid biosynthesis glycosyltransferase